MVGLPALLEYRRLGVRVDARTVAWLVVGFAMGAFGGAKVAYLFPSRALSGVFAVFLLASAWNAVRAPAAVDDATTSAAPRPPTPVAIGIGFTAGLMSGLLGIGGGIVALPLLRKYARLSRLDAQAATIAMTLLPIGLPAVYVYASEGDGLAWQLLVAVATGFTLGTGVGARFAGRVDEKRAARVYAALLVALSLLLLARLRGS